MRRDASQWFSLVLVTARQKNSYRKDSEMKDIAIHFCGIKITCVDKLFPKAVENGKQR